jgi:hypothetical protein
LPFEIFNRHLFGLMDTSLGKAPDYPLISTSKMLSEL